MSPWAGSVPTGAPPPWWPPPRGYRVPTCAAECVAYAAACVRRPSQTATPAPLANRATAPRTCSHTARCTADTRSPAGRRNELQPPPPSPHDPGSPPNAPLPAAGGSPSPGFARPDCLRRIQRVGRHSPPLPCVGVAHAVGEGGGEGHARRVIGALLRCRPTDTRAGAWLATVSEPPVRVRVRVRVYGRVRYTDPSPRSRSA
jgi:hypothetical protein